MRHYSSNTTNGARVGRPLSSGLPAHRARTPRIGSPLVQREDAALPGRLARSADITEAGISMRTDDFADWFERRARAHRFRVNRIPFAELEGWSFEEATGNLVHRTGRFFTVEGLDVEVSDSAGAQRRHWQQPIIVQPEIGILGILAKEFDGVLHFLMQVKMEPGNPGLVQLSPTVQATYSNYTKVHNGADVPFLNYFTDLGRGRVLVDALQSEHGSWFLRKSNRNMIVEVWDDDVPPNDDFCWLTLGQIGRLLRRDNLVNMDTRTVLACTPSTYPEAGVVNSDTGLLSWITGERTRHEVRAVRMPLDEVSDWVRDDYSISHVRDRFFHVVSVAVDAGSREVGSWTQPLFAPIRRGVVAFVSRCFDGVPHVLAHARVEGGFLNTVELAPTVQHTPEHYAHLTGQDRPPFLDLVLEAPSDRVRYSAVHSEEGGRFLDAENRYLIVEADEADAPALPPPGYAWFTPGQLNTLVKHGHYLNVQARTLLAVANTRALVF